MIILTKAKNILRNKEGVPYSWQGTDEIAEFYSIEDFKKYVDKNKDKLKDCVAFSGSASAVTICNNYLAKALKQTKLITYTLLKQDGTKEVLGEQEEMDFEAIRELLGCHFIEIIPSDYHQKDWGKCTLYGDEEGRFNSDNTRNPHTKVLRGDPSIGEVAVWDCVGNLLLAQY